MISSSAVSRQHTFHQTWSVINVKMVYYYMTPGSESDHYQTDLQLHFWVIALDNEDGAAFSLYTLY